MTITQESSTPPTEADPRVDLIDGLRTLADFYEQHPEFPLPYLESAFALHLQVHAGYDPDDFVALVSTLGGHREKKVSNDYFSVLRRFGPLTVEVWTPRETMCTKVETGKVHTVTVETLPAEVKAKIAELRAEHAIVETIDEPEVEWECPPSVLDLDARARGLAGVASLRDAATDARREAVG